MTDYFYSIQYLKNTFSVSRQRFLSSSTFVTQTLPCFVNKRLIFLRYYNFFKNIYTLEEFYNFYYKQNTKNSILLSICNYCLDDCTRFGFDFELRLFDDNTFSITFYNDSNNK